MAEAKAAQPTAELQLADAKKAAEKLGGKISAGNYLPGPVVDVDLSDTQVADAKLKELAGLENLPSLILRLTQVTVAGLQELAGLTNLLSLNLERTQVTDKGLKYLVGLRQLQELYLAQTKVTSNGVAELKKALPELKINR